MEPIDSSPDRQRKLPSVCVVGNLLTDLIMRGIPQLPAWGQEVAGNEHVFFSAGQATNLAQALAQLGFPVRVVGNVGSDQAGKTILDGLRCYHVDTRGVEISPGATGLTVALVRPDGERAFISDFASLKLFDLDMAQRLLENDDSQVICLVGSLNLPAFTFANAYQLLASARAAGKITVLDTGWDPNQWPPASIDGVRRLLPVTDIYLPNLDEARVLTGQSSVEACAQALLELGPNVVVVKCGKDGSYGCKAGETRSAPALDVHVYDAVGAGDVFNAGFLLGYLSNQDLQSGLVLGNTCAGLYISRQVDRFPSLQEVMKELK